MQLMGESNDREEGETMRVVENHALIFFIRSYHSRTMRAS